MVLSWDCTLKEKQYLLFFYRATSLSFPHKYSQNRYWHRACSNAYLFCNTNFRLACLIWGYCTGPWHLFYPHAKAEWLYSHIDVLHDFFLPDNPGDTHDKYHVCQDILHRKKRNPSIRQILSILPFPEYEPVFPCSEKEYLQYVYQWLYRMNFQENNNCLFL